MSKEWTSGCKRCGEEIGYSDKSYRYSLQYGFSRPEYCPKCQAEEVNDRNELGVPYFSVTVDNNDYSGSTFGKFNHPNRNHQSTDIEVGFDADRYGLTPDKIKELADWFSNSQHRVAVVVGPTGSGKSTALPYWLINPPEEIGIDPDFFTKDGQIVHTQPRIIAAQGQAEYVGERLMGGHVGAGYDAGFRYGQHDSSDWRNVWISETDGLFKNEIINGSTGKYGYVIIDEAHERSLNIDEILCLLKAKMPLYPKLKVIIASATINAQAFCDFFGRDVAKVIEFEGLQRVDENHNPVHYDVIFQEEKPLPYDDLQLLRKIIVEAAVNKTQWLTKEIISSRKKVGDVLVFLQGVDPIDQAVEKMNSFLESSELTEFVKVFPLYRDLSEDDKEKAIIHNSDDSTIHVIFATNIAEASVTIDSLGYEIETAVENQSNFDSNTAASFVSLSLIGRANCRQRWGRTGRTRNGEVYCLYTEDQFNKLLPEYPVSAIKRSSMEELLLTMKSAGISNPSIGWLENPDEREINRSKESLIKIGALSLDGNLSNKGLMLQNFSYTANILEALLLADEIGCLVELASVLPVIKNGGNKKILDWKNDWDSYEKYNAYQHHKALMSGCRDDIDFIIKIVKLWTELPLVNRNKNTNEDTLNTLRQNWAKENYINIETLELIVTERTEILDQFYEQSGEEDFRKIDLTLLSRVREVLSAIFVEIEDSDLPYRYDQKSKPKDQSQISCSCIKNIENIDFSFLMLDQICPINSKITKKLSEEKWKQSDIDKYNIEVSINNPQNQNTEKDTIEARVVGYNFENKPTILVDIINPPEPFDLFLEKYKIGDNLDVEVLEILNYPNDNSPVLVAQELITKAKIFIETTDLFFSKAASAVTLIPIASIFTVQLEQIDIKKRWINVSMYKLAEKLLNEKFLVKGKETKQTVIARVLKVESENVQFALDWANPAIGFLPVITVYRENLLIGDELKRPKEFFLGQEVLISVYRKENGGEYSLPDISKELEQILTDKQRFPDLNYSRPKLKYNQRMTFNTKNSLECLDKDLNFYQAIEKIYWDSNRIFLSSFLDIDLINQIKIKFPVGKTVDGIVSKINPQSGVNVIIGEQYKGFLPRSLVLNDFRSDLTRWFQLDDEISLQVVEVKNDLELVLKQVQKTEKPIVYSQVVDMPIFAEDSYFPPSAIVQIPTPKPTPVYQPTNETPYIKSPDPVFDFSSKPTPQVTEVKESIFKTIFKSIFNI